jgi:ABC-2 type transport system ATP-binding protein
MDKGRIVSQGTPTQLLTEHFGDVVLQIPSTEAGSKLNELGIDAVQTGEFLEIRTSHLHQTLQQLLENKINLDQLRIRAWTLEDLFINVTGKKTAP